MTGPSPETASQPACWRPARADDLPAISAVLTDPAFFDVLGAVTPEALAEACAPDGARRLLAFDIDGRLAAFAYLSGCDGDRPKLEEFAVLTRGRGTGTRALSALLEVLRAEGRASFWLHVVPDNARALALYRRLGFGREEVLPDFWQTRNGDRVDLLRLHYDFVPAGV